MGAASLARLDYAGVGLLISSPDGGHLLTGLQLDGQMDMHDLVLGVLVACCVLGFISLLGLVVACSRTGSCTRAAASTLYFATSLPVSVALGFAIAFCFAFRSEAQTLVRRYWLCLLLTDTGGAASATALGAAAAVYESITHVGIGLLAANVLLLAGLLSASRVIGAGIVAASLMNVINGGQLLVGGGLCAVATGLHTRSDGGGGGLHADSTLLALGGGVLAMAILGLLASRLHSRCLLRIYEGFALLLTLGLLGFVVGLSRLGVKGLAASSFLTQNWHYIQEVYPLSKDDFLRILSHHYTKLLIAGSLTLIVQLVVLTATCTLRRALVPPRKEAATYSERAGLISDSYDDDEEEAQIV